MIANLTGNYTKMLMGDFNINIANLKDSANFKGKLEHRHLKTAVTNEIYTTDMKTQIDIICTDTNKFLAGVYESYFSDHKPVFIEVEDCVGTLPVINKESERIQNRSKIIDVEEQHSLLLSLQELQVNKFKCTSEITSIEDIVTIHIIYYS